MAKGFIKAIPLTEIESMTVEEFITLRNDEGVKRAIAKAGLTMDANRIAKTFKLEDGLQYINILKDLLSIVFGLPSLQNLFDEESGLEEYLRLYLMVKLNAIATQNKIRGYDALYTEAINLASESREALSYFI